MPRIQRDTETLQCEPTWTFADSGGEQFVWDWAMGEPPVRELGPVRGVTSGARSWHAPVQAWSALTRSRLALESGLEFDLLLWLERQPGLSWIVAQPFKLDWGERRGHVPDLLVVGEDGAVTVWDARAEDRRDRDFVALATASRDACAHVGWAYEAFAGHPEVVRLNLRWLASCRREPEWAVAVRPQLREVIGDLATIGDVLAADGGRGYLVSTMWHLAWRGEIAIELSQRWNVDTPLLWRAAA